jgi:hypothetical protein
MLCRAWDLEDLARLDLVRIGELILVGVEDFHVGVGVAKVLLGNLAERSDRP